MRTTAVKSATMQLKRNIICREYIYNIKRNLAACSKHQFRFGVGCYLQHPLNNGMQLCRHNAENARKKPRQAAWSMLLN